jgi:Cu/Ag efflux pump CusA
MINRLIEVSLRNRGAVLVIYLALAVWGAWALTATPIDAIPDLSDNQVTYPLTTGLQGLADVRVVRSQSAFGFPMVYVVFEDQVPFVQGGHELGADAGPEQQHRVDVKDSFSPAARFARATATSAETSSTRTAPITDPSVSLEESTRIAGRQNAALMQIPEVAGVVAKVGRADTSTDPSPLNMTDAVQDVIETAIGETSLSSTIEGRQRFPIRVRYAPEFRRDAQSLREVLVASPAGAQIPLGELARIEAQRGPAIISSENGLVVATVLLNVQGRDVGGFISDARRAVADRLRLPAGYYLAWSGQYENQEHARARLLLALPTEKAGPSGNCRISGS